jgi:hypothetical protein
VSYSSKNRFARLHLGWRVLALPKPLLSGDRVGGRSRNGRLGTHAGGVAAESRENDLDAPRAVERHGRRGIEDRHVGAWQVLLYSEVFDAIVSDRSGAHLRLIWTNLELAAVFTKERSGLLFRCPGAEADGSLWGKNAHTFALRGDAPLDARCGLELGSETCGILIERGGSPRASRTSRREQRETNCTNRESNLFHLEPPS